MDIFSILEFFINMQKMKKAEALGQTNIGLDLAGKMPGGLGEVAEKFPTIGAGMRTTLGAPPKSQVMGDYPMSYFGAEQPSGFEAAKPMMTQQLSRRGVPSEVPLTREVWPQIGLTQAERQAEERLGLQKQAATEQSNAARANIFANFARPPKEAGGTPTTLQPEEIESIYSGKMPEGVVATSSLTVEKAHENQKAFVRAALPKVNYDISKLDPYIRQLGMDTKQFKMENGKWMFSSEEAKIMAPHVTSYFKGGEQITEIIRKPGQEATPEIVKAPRQLAPLEADKSLEEPHVSGIHKAAITEWYPTIVQRIKDAYPKDMKKVQEILRSMDKDPFTGQVQLYELTPHMTAEEQRVTKERIITSAELMKTKKVSSPEAWAKSAPKKSKANRIAELVAAGHNDNQIKAILKKEAYE